MTNIKVGQKLKIVDSNNEHPFRMNEIVKVVTILPETCLYVQSTERKLDGYIIKGEYLTKF